MITLPEGIDYSKYHGGGGLSTKHWGPSYWTFLFTSVMGTYPVKVDWDNTDHTFLVNEFKNAIMSLISILPCIFCRESLNGFIGDLPMEDYMNGRIEMMYWLYLIKNKVNTKLIRQERRALREQKQEILQRYPNNRVQYLSELSKCKAASFKTVPTPPFEEVLEQYEALRAVCSPKAKRCVLPEK